MPLDNLITANVPVLDDCQVLTRLKVYVTQLGITPTIQHTVRDRLGQPQDLSEYFGVDGEDPEEGELGKLYLRCKELVADAGPDNKVRQVEGMCIDPTQGLIQFELDPEMIDQAGIYQLAICVADHDENSLKIESPLLWVERSLFRMRNDDTTFNFGPPTIAEIRQAVMDAGAGDNVLLDDVEFSDDQLAFAVGRPLHLWNSSPPPLRPPKDTRDFPFREDWLNAICGHLFVAAAHNYHRNYLQINAGGLAVDDKAKGPQYMTIGQKLLEDWKNFVQSKKYEINVGLFQGRVGSIYGGLFH